MQARKYVGLFFLYGILGWVIDTLYRSILAGEFYAVTGWLIPFTPVYAVGALIALLVHQYINKLWWPWQFFIFGAVMAAIEYVAGWLVLVTRGTRFWDYSDAPFNLHGHTDLYHLLAWGGLSLVFVYWIHPLVIRILSWCISTRKNGIDKQR